MFVNFNEGRIVALFVSICTGLFALLCRGLSHLDVILYRNLTLDPYLRLHPRVRRRPYAFSDSTRSHVQDGTSASLLIVLRTYQMSSS